MLAPLADFAPWFVARFQTELARDQFLSVVATQQIGEVESAPMPDESHAAMVRWRPGKFLGLNDVAHALGGRINVRASRSRRG